MTEKTHTNRLAGETSPYLLQHQHNPVDWYPWGDEALERARRENKPILLSIGYSACHWCHVMERESFENEDIAALMNAEFVNIKVDREERPDVDHIYMQVVQAMTGHGGWPLTVFLTPDLLPIYGGTYFPPDDRRGMPAFPRVLEVVSRNWAERPETFTESGQDLLSRIDRIQTPAPRGGALSPATAEKAFERLSETVDRELGGLQGAPKFPQPMTWSWALRHWARTGNDSAREIVETTLRHMARGGVYDQIGGGFHRYAVDARWRVPHFEKMLYDNALLASLYVEGYLAFGSPQLQRTAEQILDYLAREMRHPKGGFFSSQDADSEGEEGKFFVWTPQEVETALGGRKEARVATAYWGLDRPANFEGRHVLEVPSEPSEVAEALGLSLADLEDEVEQARARLFEVREARARPGRDEKILAAWNGLACRAFAEAARALDRDDYLEIAVSAGEFLVGAMRREDGRLLRSFKDGEARLPAYLEDYALTIGALVAVYQATFDDRWLREASTLADDMVRLFWDSERGAFYDTGADAEALVVRPREIVDNASPCGSSAAAEALLRLAVLTGDERYREHAEVTLAGATDTMERFPAGAGRFLAALDFHLGPVAEVALVWPRGAGPEPFFGPLYRAFRPNLVLAGAEAGSESDHIPLLEGRRAIGDAPTAYVCQHYACQIPTNDPAVLAAQLDGLTP